MATVTRGSERHQRRSASGQPARPAAASAGGNGAPQQPALPERAHGQDPQPQLLGERQDARLGGTLARVHRDLDRVDPAGPHDPLQLGSAPPE